MFTIPVNYNNLPCHEIVAPDFLHPFVNFTRSTTKTYFDASGVMQTAAIDTPAFDYLQDGSGYSGLSAEGNRTNSITNSTMAGSGSGAAPTLWGFFTGSGITRTHVGTGIVNGMTYHDIRYSGTAGSSSTAAIFFNNATSGAGAAAAVNGQEWTESAYLAIVAGDLTGINNAIFSNSLRNSGGTFLSTISGSDFKASLSASLQQFSFVGTVNNASTAFIRPDLTFTWTIGAVIDFTLRIAAPQLELGSSVSSFIPTTAAAVSRSADVVTIDLTGANWFNPLEYTIAADFRRCSGVITSTTAIHLDDGTADNAVRIIQRASADNLAFGGRIEAGGVNQASTDISSGNANVRCRLALAAAANNYGICLKGGSVTTDLTVTMPTGLTTLRIGNNSAGDSALFGNIRSIRLYPGRLADPMLPLL